VGWTFTHKDQGLSIADFFREEFASDGGRGVVDCAVVGFRTAYIAYQMGDGVIAYVCLLSYKPNDYYSFGYKDMDERMGPCEDKCPERILRRLTPLEPLPEGEENTGLAFAHAWRARCWANIAKRKDKPVFKDGDVVTFKTPIQFNHGWGKVDRFLIRVLNNRPTFWCGSTHFNVRGWEDMEYTITKSGMTITKVG
jgi:hypothetical protein